MKYTGKPVAVNHPAQDLYARISNLSALQERLNTLPQEQLAKVGEVRFPDDDSFVINAPGMGEVTFRITERVEPERVTFQAMAGPVPLSMSIDLKPVDEAVTNLTTVIDVEIPLMLRPLVGGKMQEAADKFSEMIAQLNA